MWVGACLAKFMKAGLGWVCLACCTTYLSHYSFNPSHDMRMLQVKANGLVVFIPKYGIEGPVYLGPKAPGSSDPNNAEAANWVLDDEAQTVTAK